MKDGDARSCTTACRAHEGKAMKTTTLLTLASGLLLLALAGCGNQSTAIDPDGALLTRLSNGPVVNSLADPGIGTCDATQCTLRDAIAAADSGDTITFAVTGTIVLHAQLVIDKDLTIEGPGAASLTVSGNKKVRVFDITAGTAVRISGLTITSGWVDVGAGIRSFSEDLVLSRVVVAGNRATYASRTLGGGIASYGTLTLVDSHVTDNAAGGPSPGSTTHSGGIYSKGPLTVRNSAITGNWASAQYATAPGILCEGPTTITNSTIVGNQSGSVYSGGGGILALSHSHLALVNSTVTGNTAARGGGIYIDSTASATLTNTLVADNIAIEWHPDLQALGTVNAMHSLIGDAAGHSIDNETDGNIVGVSAADLYVGALADNGGLTPTLALLPGSPAIDAASSARCPATDQRGVLRPQGAGCDIGAFEYYEHEWVVTGFFSPVNDAPTLNTAKAGQSIPLKWHLEDVFGNPITDLDTATVSVTSLACTAGTTTDAIEEYAKGASGLQNMGDGYYQFNWATPKSYAGTCKTLHLDLSDGITQTALFQFTK
jgi:CSLREA domain-containing protein